MLHEGSLPVTLEAYDGFLKQETPTYDFTKEHSSQPNTKPSAKRYDHRFSLEGLALEPTPLKDSAKTLDFSKMIPLGNGRPAAEMTPWKELTMHTTRPEIRTMSCVKGESSFDLAEALDYGFSRGSTQLIDFLTEHVQSIHNPPYRDWAMCLSCGSTSAIERALRVFCNRGDYILVEQYTYPGVITAAQTLGIKLLGIGMDDDGIDPKDLDKKLCSWDPTKGKKPFLLYTVPSGQNPTGATQSAERKKAIYQIAEKHDLYIVEDDPYYFLRLDAVGNEDYKPTTDEFQKSLPATYLSLDVSGRVLRLDSASKILAPGLRLGWITGCSQVIEKFVEQADMSTLASSGPSQVMVYKLLCETWGHHGFLSWLIDLSSRYRRRRDIMMKACTEHLPANLCQWSVPTVGMFLWIKIHSTRLRGQSSLCEIEERVCGELEERGVMVARGNWFWVGSESMDEVHFRLTFAAAPPTRLEEAIRTFGQVLRNEFGVAQ